MIRSIDVAEAIASNEFTRFVTGLAFVGSSLDGNLTMTHIIEEIDGNGVPEPSALVLRGLGVTLLLRSRRRTPMQRRNVVRPLFRIVNLRDVKRAIASSGWLRGQGPGQRGSKDAYNRL